MKKRNGWFWVKLCVPGLLVLPFILAIFSDIFDFQFIENLTKKLNQVSVFTSACIAVIWANFFPRNYSSKYAKWMITSGLALFIIIMGFSDNLEHSLGFSSIATDILEFAGLGLTFAGFVFSLFFAFTVKPKRKSAIDIARHATSALCVLTLVLLFGFGILEQLGSSINAPNFINKNVSELVSVFFCISGIGYYISNILYHENPGSNNHENLIEEIGA